MTIIQKIKKPIYKNLNSDVLLEKGITNKKEGDKKTPKGIFKLGNLFYRSDRKDKPKTKLSCIKINKNMGWWMIKI